MGIKVLFSHSTNHYIRLYSSISYGAKKADESLEKMGFILHCFKCLHRETYLGIISAGLENRCSECGSNLKFAGPLWLGSIYDIEFCKKMEENLKILEYLGGEAKRIASLIMDEADAPVSYYVIDKISERAGLPTPPLKNVIENIRSMGFKAVRTHFNSRGLKTDAQSSIVIKAVKEAAQKLSQ
jgi:tRNA (guanine26-N2/guanine27-N2)-dimethyltransferase